MSHSKPFDGLKFLFSGTLPTLARVEAESIVRENGGEVLPSVTSDLNYIVVGLGPDDNLQKALELGTVTVLSEDEFTDMMNQDSQAVNDEDDEDLQRIIDELGDLDKDSSDEDESGDESEDESTDEFPTWEDLMQTVLDEELESAYETARGEADSDNAGDDSDDANGDSNRSDLDESIDNFVSYANSIEEPSGLLLLTSFTLIDIMMRDSSLDDSMFFGKFTRFVGWMHAQAYEWGIADEGGFLPRDLMQEYLAQSKALSDSYSKAVADDSVSYRTFLKNIGAAGIGASLSPEERGDLSTYLLMFKHAVSLLFVDSYASISRDVNATIEQIDCSDIIGDLSGVAEQGGNAFVESYRQ